MIKVAGENGRSKTMEGKKLPQVDGTGEYMDLVTKGEKGDLAVAGALKSELTNYNLVIYDLKCCEGNKQVLEKVRKLCGVNMFFAVL